MSPLASAFLFQSLIVCIQALNVAIIGEGVIGTSTALAIKRLDKDVNITVYHDKDFKDILSHGIAGLFRIDDGKPINRLYGAQTFERLAELWREFGGNSGVQLVSGHILSQSQEKLDAQWENYGQVVYNYVNLTYPQLHSQFKLENDELYKAIHYTAFTSEGARYIPWMKKLLEETYDVMYIKQHIDSVEELGDDGYDVVVNCGGLAGGKLAADGDEKKMYPIRGLLLKTNASWQKHFLYRDFTTFTIPVIDAVYVGTIKEEHNDSLVIDEESIEKIWGAYLELQPAFKDVEIIDRFVGLRPARVGGARVKAETRNNTNGNEYRIVHNYGHGGNGFTLGWGSAEHAARLALGFDTSQYDELLNRVHIDMPKDVHKEKPKEMSDQDRAIVK
ncbi:unnamed protein product, partial [Mesorhabditis belari]|uniref:FAD dependent oxidoreductase domain-containing protein n=1 Tax=Mesorhabditis belari TaxID=2138241 RepID=A0AAF3EVD9_9BILA